MALDQAWEVLWKAECVLFFVGGENPVFKRKLSIKGEERLMTLKETSVRFITQKSRVQLLLTDFERFHDQVPEVDRPDVENWLGRLRDLHLSFQGVCERVKGVMRAEEERVREGYACDPYALDELKCELEVYERELAGFRKYR